ncbi:hypothetical protein [Streptosporangium sp. LJ11]|uniref:hypothetical protein n=1 Tax=Streptosporangium sp. LJ11 TaxID=3436927 RepID=UPI003F78F23A
MWRELSGAGLDAVPSNTFSLYDHVLDTIALVGAVPERVSGRGAAASVRPRPSRAYFFGTYSRMLSMRAWPSPTFVYGSPMTK